MPVAERPRTRDELADGLREAAEAGTPVALRGAGTKAGWDPRVRPGAAPVSTLGLDRVVEHNPGDLTAVLEAGVPLARAQELFAAAGQMLALDPPGAEATLGGIVASGDSGPLRGRYGGPRDLVLGVGVALSDGTLARSGGKVIKNVAGYDLAKLFCGSFGALGAIVELSVRLHPLPGETLTVVGSTSDPDALGRGALALAAAPFEHIGLDLRWEAGRGALLIRFAGAAPRSQAEVAARLLAEAGLAPETVDGDESLWLAQREGQRGPCAVRVSGLPSRLPVLLRAADAHSAAVVGRAGLGISWICLPEPSAAAVDELRRSLAPSPCVVLDRPPELDVDARGPLDPGADALGARVKERFDPAGIL